MSETRVDLAPGVMQITTGEFRRAIEESSAESTARILRLEAQVRDLALAGNLLVELLRSASYPTALRETRIQTWQKLLT